MCWAGNQPTEGRKPWSSGPCYVQVHLSIGGENEHPGAGEEPSMDRSPSCLHYGPSESATGTPRLPVPQTAPAGPPATLHGPEQG